MHAPFYLASLACLFGAVSCLPLPSKYGQIDPFQYDFVGGRSTSPHNKTSHDHWGAPSQHQNIQHGHQSSSRSIRETLNTVSNEHRKDLRSSLSFKLKKKERENEEESGSKSDDDDSGVAIGNTTNFYRELSKGRKSDMLKKLTTLKSTIFKDTSLSTIRARTAAVLDKNMLKDIEKGGPEGLLKAANLIESSAKQRGYNRYSGKDEETQIHTVKMLAARVWGGDPTTLQSAFAELQKLSRKAILEIANMPPREANIKLNEIRAKAGSHRPQNLVSTGVHNYQLPSQKVQTSGGGGFDRMTSSTSNSSQESSYWKSLTGDLESRRPLIHQILSTRHDAYFFDMTIDEVHSLVPRVMTNTMADNLLSHDEDKVRKGADELRNLVLKAREGRL